MNFFQNLSVRTKFFSGIFLIILIFLILIFWQFSKLDSIENQLVVLQSTERSSNIIKELSEINKQEMALLLEIIQTEELGDLQQFYEEHNFTSNKINPLYDSLFYDIKVIFPDNSKAERVKIVNYLNENHSKINNVLLPYFENVNSIKKAQLEVGDLFGPNELLEINQPEENDTTETESAEIVLVEESVVSGSSRSVQLVKLYKFYKQNYIQLNNQYSEISKILRSELQLISLVLTIQQVKLK
ncbi:MAG: hypothetical protein HC831_25540 [Chloroflexia bacterium]|nr:hypothetical protein [Chloroflexia bacterium]